MSSQEGTGSEMRQSRRKPFKAAKEGLGPLRATTGVRKGRGVGRTQHRTNRLIQSEKPRNTCVRRAGTEKMRRWGSNLTSDRYADLHHAELWGKENQRSGERAKYERQDIFEETVK